MGCSSCGGNKARARVMGTVPTMPMILGQDNASLPVRMVLFQQAHSGVSAGATRYVRGSDVDSMIVNGILRLSQSPSGV